MVMFDFKLGSLFPVRLTDNSHRVLCAYKRVFGILTFTFCVFSVCSSLLNLAEW